MMAESRAGYTGSSWQILPMERFMSMTSMNVSLPEELKEYVEAQTKRGYSTPSEYVRELIREDQKRRAKTKLDALLLEGLNSGDPAPMDAKFWAELKQERLIRQKARRPEAKWLPGVVLFRNREVVRTVSPRSGPR